LEKLTAATRRISKKDFYNEVQVLSRDEFGQLAGSFNAMSRELAKQFNAITALSRVDRVILTTIDVSQVIEMIMHYMPKTISCNQISITVIDKTVKNMACTYTQVNGNKDTQVKRHPLKIDQSKTLLENPNGIWTDHDEGFSSLLIPLEPSKVQSVFMLPVITQAYLVGIIALGFESIQAADEDNLIQARSFADRLAVALATAEREEKLYKRANFDALTGLPNRQLLKDRLSHELAHAKRDGNRLAMLFLDLDRFKNVNDSLGHSVGDLLLINVAQRLKQCIQESDTIARFGGDEFIIVLSKIDSVEDVVVITEQISNVLSTPMRLDGKDHFVSTSIGIAIFPDNGTTSEELLRNADTAMYRAKNSGQGKYAFFEKRMNAAMLERISLESDLHHALARNELFLVFQPQINLHTERVSGAEVLIRWRHPNKGLVAPNRFLPIAEDTGIIVPIGNWVLREACRQLLIWEKAGIRINHLAVNVSVLQFRETNFLDTIHHLLDQFKISPERLELEITESLLMDDIENVSAVLHLLKTLGIRIAIDDFGTGYSSLKYLQKLPIDTLKVDQSFTRNLTRNASSVVLTKAMIAMARSMNMETVVEGVETEEQLNILQDQNCDSVQGFFFSQPLETKAFVNFVRTQNARNRKLTSFPRQSSA
jgi:diguanylate cyclase (GGDEF)-like protein